MTSIGASVESVCCNSNGKVSHVLLKFQTVELKYSENIPYGHVSCPSKSPSTSWALLRCHLRDGKIRTRWLKLLIHHGDEFLMSLATQWSFFNCNNNTCNYDIAILPEYMQEAHPLDYGNTTVTLDVIKTLDIENLFVDFTRYSLVQAINDQLKRGVSISAGDRFWVDVKTPNAEFPIAVVIKKPEKECFFHPIKQKIRIEGISSLYEPPPRHLLTGLDSCFVKFSQFLQFKFSSWPKVVGVLGPHLFAQKLLECYCISSGKAFEWFPIDINLTKVTRPTFFWLPIKELNTSSSAVIKEIHHRETSNQEPTTICVGLDSMSKFDESKSLFHSYLDLRQHKDLKQDIERIRLMTSPYQYLYSYNEGNPSTFEKLIAQKRLVQRSPTDAQIPNVHWTQVGGLEDAKETLQRILGSESNYLRKAAILLYGPPGTGKTFIAKALATESNFNFIAVKGPELLDMYIGQSEYHLRELFLKAKEASPCIIFFDELDSIGTSRGNNFNTSNANDRLVSQLVLEMDRLVYDPEYSRLFVIGATNRLDLLDPALLRAGRFDTQVELGQFSKDEDVMKVLRVCTEKYLVSIDVDFQEIAHVLFLGRATPAMVAEISRLAMKDALRKAILQADKTGFQIPSDHSIPISMDNFITVIQKWFPDLD